MSIAPEREHLRVDSRPRVQLTRPGTTAPNTSARKPNVHRRDIDGLRAIAILLVVTYHAGVPFVSGGYVGVDVFFVISGFLITGLLLQEVARTGTISIRDFYARRARRLLPASALVLAVTVVVSHAILSPLAAQRVNGDAIASTLYVANWHFALQTSDYFAAQVNASPLLHYWSLAVEEQFYMLWPLLILGAFGIGVARSNRFDTTALRRIVLALGAVGVFSFLWSALLTTSQPGWSYYGLQARAWELAIGAGLAALTGSVGRLPRIVVVLGGWCGLAMIIFSALHFNDSTSYPGTAALVPVVGTALVIMAGVRSRNAGTPLLLSHHRLVAIGLISYSLYLWHWPLLTFARTLTSQVTIDGEPIPAPWWAMVGAVVASFAMAIISTRFIENPVRNSPLFKDNTNSSLILGAALTTIPVLLVMAPLPGPFTSANTTVAGVVDAASLDPSVLASIPNTAPNMSALDASNDGVTGMRDCHQSFPAAPLATDCLFGDARGSKTIVLVGDSHAQHWFPALERAASRNGWKLYAWTKSACPMVEVSVNNNQVGGAYTACDSWRKSTLNQIRNLSANGGVDLVVVGRSGGYGNGSGSSAVDANGQPLDIADAQSAWATGTTALLRDLRGAKRIALLQDTPWAPSDRTECLSAHMQDSSACAFIGVTSARERALIGAEQAGLAGHSNASSVDVTDLVCPGRICREVTDSGTVVFRDQHHMTQSFSRSIYAGVAGRIKGLLST